MKTDKIKNRIKKSPLLALGLSMAVVIVAIAAIVAGLVSAMYKQERQVVSAPTQITVSADLADTLEVWEHQVTRTTLGDYEIAENAALVHNNNYTLMPGVDIPKDTFVRVTNKTELDAYLFIRVVSTVNDEAISYEVDSSVWQPLTDVTPSGGGSVYYYAPAQNPTGVINSGNFEGTGGVKDVKVLSGYRDEIKVGQYLQHDSAAQSSVLTVYAYMVQALNTPQGSFVAAGLGTDAQIPQP